MESLFCYVAQVFSYANEPNGDATKAFHEVLWTGCSICVCAAPLAEQSALGLQLRLMA